MGHAMYSFNTVDLYIWVVEISCEILCVLTELYFILLGSRTILCNRLIISLDQRQETLICV